jgi:superfamily II DNA/RNA helicase
VATFATLGVPADLVDALSARGIEQAFPVQAATIPDALAGRDVCGKAPTGSGKTIAFGVPLVANVQRARPKRPRALVLVPTRELAAQVARDLEDLGALRGCRVHAFYGGVGFEGQLKALRHGVDIAVACPGRLSDLVNRGDFRLDGVDLVVVDEADRMADMGFLPEVKRILDQTSDDRQTLLFSATLDGDVDVLVKRYQHQPAVHDVTPPEPDRSLVRHHLWLVDRAERVDLCASIISRRGPTIVFTRTRHGADRLATQLERAGIGAAAIHGDRSQAQRDRALAAFAGGRVAALVATDVAARGIHVDNVACVIHHDLPADEKDYVHRSGRTGRAGEEGTVIALVLADQRKDAAKLARKLDLDAELTAPDLGLLGEARPVPRPSRSATRPPKASKAPTINSTAAARGTKRPGRREREAARAAARDAGETQATAAPRRKPRPEHRSGEARPATGARKPKSGKSGPAGARGRGTSQQQGGAPGTGRRTAASAPSGGRGRGGGAPRGGARRNSR